MGNGSFKIGSHNEWHALLETTTVEKIKGGKNANLISINADDNVKTVIEVLCKNKLLGAPVIDHTSFVDFVYLSEIAAELATLHKDRVVPAIEKIRHPDQAAAADTLNTDVFFNSKIRDMLKHQRTKFVRVYPSTTLLDLARQMTAQKVYRVAVCDPNTQRLIDLLTQSDIIHWIYEHKDQEWFSKHCAVALSAIMMEKPLTKVTQGQITVDCFGLLRKFAISSVPVVTEDGRLFSILSPKILRGLSPADAQSLLQPIGNFIAARKEPQGAEVITVTLETTMLQALAVLTNARQHRLYIVNKNHEPIGVLSLTDVIAWLVKMEADPIKEKKEHHVPLSPHKPEKP